MRLRLSVGSLGSDILWTWTLGQGPPNPRSRAEVGVQAASSVLDRRFSYKGGQRPFDLCTVLLQSQWLR
ncbi:hypothetical protein GUJ93_ZPchr0012g21068 [Zizania palustris]|uniref:Uncharacterized protein n=1 Tax=Zizania palustris TaxID=103762 RepID=A0A8J5WRL5_ZIZPA|nr:hypothetical protein GUJ93_ZPchr0012g21068 [Zizania palustris]